MANIITAPESGIYFDGNTAGVSSIPTLTGDASGVAIQYDGYAGIEINSSATGANYLDRFSVEGANGRLFGVTDEVTGTVFSVNDAAGLPIIEVESTSDYDKITIGEYGTDALVVSGDSVGIGTNSPAYRLDVTAAQQHVARFTSTTADNGGLIINKSNASYNPNLLLQAGGSTKWYILSASNDSNKFQLYESSGANPRFTLTQEGNLGIGTTSPNKNLTIAYSESSTNKSNTLGGAAEGSGLLIHNSASGSGSYANLDFRSHTADGRILYSYNGTSNSGDFHFITDNTASFGTKLFIGDSGNVGIGTTSPSTALTIRKAISSAEYGAQASMIEFKSYFAGYDTETVKSAIYSGVSDTGSLNTQGGYMSFHVNNNGTMGEKLRIDKSGSVGIGTTLPTTNVHPQLFMGTTAYLLGGTGGSLDLGVNLYYNSGWKYRTTNEASLLDFNAGGDMVLYTVPSGTANSAATLTSRFIVDNTGKVGIGTTSPNSKLQVKSSGSNIDEITLVHSGNTVKIAALGQESSHGSLHLRHNTGVNKVRLSAGGNSSYILDSNVGIGTTSPGRPLTINSDTAHKAIRILENDSGNESWDIGVDVDGDLNFFNSADTSPTVTFSDGGNVGIGTTSPAKKLDVVGNAGISGQLLLNSPSYNDHLAIRRGSYGYDTIVTGSRVDYSPTTATDTFKFLADLQTTGDLAVSGNATVANELYFSSNNTGITMKDASGTNTRVLRLNSGNTMYIGPIDPYAGGQIFYGVASQVTAHKFHVGAAAKLTIDSSSATFAGDLTVTGGDITLGGTGRIQGIDTVSASTDAANKAYVDAQVATSDTLQEVTDNGATTSNLISIHNDSTVANPRLSVGRDSNQSIQFSVTDTINTIQANQDADSNSDHKFILNRYFSGSGENDFQIQKAGSPQLTIDKDGNVGIGNTAPLQKLSVNGIINSDTNEDYYGAWMNGNSAAGQDSYFAAGTWYNNAGYFKFIQSGTPHRLSIYTYNTSDHVTLQEAGGNVGIGTTSPSEKLHVQGSVMIKGGGNVYTKIDHGNVGFIQFTDTSISAPNQFLIQHNYAQDNDFRIARYTGGSDFVIDSGGNIGIGTTSPNPHSWGQKALTVQAAGTNAYSALETYGTGTGAGAVLFGADSIMHSSVQSTNGSHLVFTTNASNSGTSQTERMRILSSGQLIVGGTAFGYSGTDLQVGNTSDSQNGLNILTSTTGYGYVLFGDGLANADSYVGQISYKHGDDYMAFRTAGTEKIRIDSDGNVGIGRTDPSTRLDVKGNDGKVPVIKLSDGSANGFTLLGDHYNSTSNILSLGISHSGANVVLSRSVKVSDTADDTYLSSQATFSAKPTAFSLDSDGSFRFLNTNTNATTNVDTAVTLTERLRITSAGNVGIGTTSPSTKLDVDGLISSDQIQSKEYTSLTGSSEDWFSIGTVDDQYIGPVYFNVVTYAHSSMSFVVGDGYSGSGKGNITLLNSVDNRNGSFANITAARVKDDGSVEIKLLWDSGPTVDVKITARSTTNPVALPASLATATSTSTVRDTVTNETGKLRSKNLITTDSNVVLNNSGDSYLNGGKVGIGTTSPSAKLHVVTNNSAAQLYLQRTGSITGNYRLGVAGATNRFYITDVAQSQDRLVINQSGNVGIGTISPAQKLDVDGNIVAARFIQDTNAGNDFYAAGFTRSSSSLTNPDIYDLNGYGLVLGGTSNEGTLVVKAGGNVGIGTASPSEKLDVAGNITTSGVSTITAAYNGSNYMQIGGNTSGGTLVGYDGGVHTTMIRSYGDSFLNGGNVGIGTTSPNNFGFLETALEISAGSSSSTTLQQAGLVLSGSSDADDADDFAYLSFTNHQSTISNGRVAEIRAYKNGSDVDTGELAFFTVLSERMRIDKDGNVGIGTNSPSNKLDIAGGLEVNAEAYIRSTNNVGLRIQTTDQGITSSDGLRVGLNSTHAFVWQYENLPLSFGTNGSQKATILANGNFGIGDTTPSYKLDVNGTLRSTGAAYFNSTVEIGSSLNMTDGDITNGYNIYGNYFRQRAHGIPRNNLGDPTVTEMALFEPQFTCKTDLSNSYNDLSDLEFYVQSTSSSEWTEVTSYSDDNKRKFLRTNNSGVIIPNLSYKYRVEFNAQSYTFANALYMYWSSNSHSTQVHIWKQRASDDTWIQHTSSTNTVSSWPGHLWLPFSTIPWLEDSTSTSTGHYHKVRIEFTPNWSGHATYGDRDINLYGGQIWGGYPRGRRTPHYYDQNGLLTTWGQFKIGDIPSHSSEATALVVNTSNVVGYRELGSNAFDSTSYLPLSGGTLTGDLQVSTTEFTNINLKTSRTGATDNIGGVQFYKSSTLKGQIFGVNDGKVKIATGGSTVAMTLDENQNVGIGTTSPVEKLTVAGGSGAMLGFKRFFSDTGVVPAGVGSSYSLTASLNDEQGTTLTSQFQYKFYLTTIGTGTYNSSVYIVYRNGGDTAWVAHRVSSTGLSSNHPELTVSGNNALIFNDHASAYTVAYRVESTYSGQAKTSPQLFGSDYMWTRDNTELYYMGGSVGIGTTSPNTELHVDGTGQFGDYLKIGTGVTAGYYQDSGNGAYRAIGTGGNKGYYFQSYAGASTTMYVGLTGAYAGNVGIGTTNPSQELEVNGTVLANDYRALYNIYLTSPDSWIFRSTGGTERVRVTSAGNVGIGTTSPNVRLELRREDSGDLFELNRPASTVSALYGGVASNHPYLYSNNGIFTLGVNNPDGGTGGEVSYITMRNGSTRYTTFEAGNVGIGITNPLQKLHVSGNVDIDNGGILLQQGYGINTGISGYDIWMPTTTRVGIQTAGAERLSILNNGNVGIGTTSPASQLHLYGASGATGEIRLESSNGKAFTIGSTGTSYGSANNLIIYDINASTERLRIDTNGNVGIGTTNPRTALEVEGTITHKVYSASSLPSASPAGQRAFISDSAYGLATAIGSVVSGGGSNTIPVYSDGSSWRAG